jgi:hypothetical protein
MVAPEIQRGISGSAARNSDYWTTVAVNIQKEEYQIEYPGLGRGFVL